MALPDFGKLRGGMAVACADFSKILSRHAIQAIERLAMITRRDQKVVEGSPIVSPIEIEACALTKFRLVNLAAPPLIEDMLIAGKNGFDAENHGTIADHRSLLEDRCRVTLRGAQRVVVANQDNVGRTQTFAELIEIEN